MKKKKLNKVDKYIIMSVILLLLYTIVDRVILVKTGLSSDTLTTCFFAAFGTEILSCCVIKSLNIHNEGKQIVDPEPINSKGDGVG